MSCLKLFTLITCAILLSTVTDVVQGKYVYQSDVQRSIEQDKVVATWEEAKQRCASAGAILASPIDEKLLKHMLSYIDVNNHTNSYFIGIKAKYNPEPQFLSAEGILLDDLPEVVLDMIDQLNPREGDCLAMNRDSIRVVHCWDRLPYICYTKVEPTTIETKVEPPTTETAIELSTPVPDCDHEGYEYYSSTGSCYKLHPKSKLWSDAKTTCENEGGYLVIVNDEKEAKTIVEIMKVNNVYSGTVWIGLIDDTLNGDWRSIHGDPFDKIYHKMGDKPIFNTPDGCGILKSDVKLYDGNCEFHVNFICEKSI